MKYAFIAMGLMALLMIGGGGLINMIFTPLLGGGIEQSYIYPIYGGIIVLTGVVVGAAKIIIDEIRELKKSLEDGSAK